MMEPPPTLEELAKKLRIYPQLLDQKCSDEHLRSISLFLDWRKIAPHLGLSKTCIEAIEFEKRTEDERRLEVLQKWKAKYGYKATFKNLAAVLLKIENADDAERVCCLLQTPAGKHSSSTATTTTPTTPGENQLSSSVTAAETAICSTVAEPSEVSVQSPKIDIDGEIQELESLFLNIVSEAAEDLTTVKLSRVKVCVTQLPVSVKYQHLHFLEHNRSAITSATSVDDILAVLGLYWNYLNCGLLKELVCRLGNDATKQLMEQYMETLKLFRLKTRLGDFFGKVSANTPPHFTTFITKLGEGWEDCTLEDLEQFRKELAHSMYLKEYAMHFNCVETGSVAITWVFHSSLPEITVTLQSAFQLLESKYSLLQVIFQGKCIPQQRPLEIPPLATPPESERREQESDTFDIIAALLNAGVPHIVEQILQSLDVKSLVMSEQVSSIWRDVIRELHRWKHQIQHHIESNPLWMELFKRRGWHNYLDVPPAEQVSRQFYRQLHHSACRDIHSLEKNWRRGHCTLTKVKTGSRVRCLQYDYNKIVTGHGDNTIKIWDRNTLQLLRVLEGHKDRVNSLQFNSEVIVSGSYDHTVKVWDILTGQLMNDLIHHKGRVYSLKFSTDTLVTGSDDETVAVWKIVSPTDITLRMTLIGHQGMVLAVDLSETTIISGSHDQTIKVWGAFTGELVRTLRGHSDWVWCLQLQGDHLISGSVDSTIRIWDVDTGECARVLHGHNDLVMCVAVHNKRIVSGSYDRTIKFWDLAAALDTGSSSDTLCITTLKEQSDRFQPLEFDDLQEHRDWVSTLQFDDYRVISGYEDGTLVIHDFLDPTPPILKT